MKYLKYLFVSIFITLFLIEAVAQSHITYVAISNEIDPVTKIYKKISIDSIRRTENRQELYCIDNFKKELEVLHIQERFMPNDIDELNTTRLFLVMMAVNLGLLDEAISYGKTINDQIGNGYEPDNTLRIQLYSLLALAYEKLGRFEEARECYEAILIFDMPLIFKAELYNDLAGVFLSNKDIKNGEYYFSEAEKIAEQNSDKPLMYRLLFTKSILMRLKGDFQGCISISKGLLSELDWYKMTSSFQGNTELQLLENLMWCSHMLGNLEDAMKYGELILNKIKSSPFAGTIVEANYLMNIARVESSYILNDKPRGYPDISNEELLKWLNRHKSAVEKIISASDIYRNLKGENSEEFLGSQSCLSGTCILAGFFEEAIDIDKNIIKICETNNLINSDAFTLSAMQLISLHNDDIIEADSLKLPKADLFRIADKLVGEIMNKTTNHSIGAFWLCLLDNYIKWQDIEKAEVCLSQGYAQFKSYITTNLKQIDDLQTISNYWNTIDRFILLGIGYKSLWENPKNLNIFYDEALLYKSMKLSLFINLFDTNAKEQLLNLSWENVKNNLKDGEGAVEILRVANGLEYRNNIYVALAITKDSSNPSIMYLCPEDELSEFPVEERYSSSAFTTMIFGPILNWVNEKKLNKVYFSPMGEYSNIGLESLKSDSGEILSDNYNMIRLSSTRELCLKNDNNHPCNLVAFGDINFNSRLSETSETIYDGNQKSSETLNYLRTSLRGQNFKYLKGTAIELDSISRICNINNIDFTAYRRWDASENSFRLLKIGHSDILHIATHGFYWNDNNENQNYQRQLQYYYNVDQPPFVEDKSMLNSGLVLAGANETLREGVLENPQNDGILTAQEISQMNFKDVELVVLSACRTGLGEVMGDGVFGLQRGFKQAGVNSIIMSLWEVDDDATQLLMTEFYKNYLSGKSKRESLLNAQKVVRETPGFEDPEYWAAFILLDGLN